MAKKSDYPVFEPFNPLDKRHLGASVANALLESETYPLPPEPFIGAGVYALYYLGDFPAYEVLAEVNRNGQYACPIYVGKAVPDGARKGGQGDDVDPGTALFKRLTDHAKSLDAATNLKLEDFRCRFLSVDDIWIPLTESLLIWDCLHPGRAWAERLQPCAFTAEELEQRVREYLNDALL